DRLRLILLRHRMPSGAPGGYARPPAHRALTSPRRRERAEEAIDPGRVTIRSLEQVAVGRSGSGPTRSASRGRTCAPTRGAGRPRNTKMDCIAPRHTHT